MALTASWPPLPTAERAPTCLSVELPDPTDLTLAFRSEALAIDLEPLVQFVELPTDEEALSVGADGVTVREPVAGAAVDAVDRVADVCPVLEADRAATAIWAQPPTVWSTLAVSASFQRKKGAEEARRRRVDGVDVPCRAKEPAG